MQKPVGERADRPCPRCGSENLIIIDDEDAEAGYPGPEFQCPDCGAWFRDDAEVDDQDDDEYDDWLDEHEE